MNYNSSDFKQGLACGLACKASVGGGGGNCPNMGNCGYFMQGNPNHIFFTGAINLIIARNHYDTVLYAPLPQVYKS